MNQIDRTAVITLKLSEVAKQFGYKTEADSEEDVYHNGYSSKDIRNQDLNLPQGMDNLNKFFPSVVAHALENCERDGIAAGIVKYSISALEECLLKIDLTGGSAEYQDGDGNSISAKAGITHVVIDQANDSITVTILNPEHLINTMVHGVGRVYPDLSSTEPATNDEIIKRFHNLNDYFEVYGESKPSADLPSHYCPDIDDESLKAELEFRLSELSLEDVAQAVIDYIETTDEEVSEEDLRSYNLPFSFAEIKEEALKINNQQKESIASKIN